jgi:ATP-binding protein involved in chromosome partitioning
MMAELTKERLVDELKRIAAPDGRGSIVSAGLVGEIAIQQGHVMFALSASQATMASMEQLRRFVSDTVAAVPGVKKVTVALTADKSPALGRGPTAAPARSNQSVQGITHLIAVASGKGGVGKSTTAINIALALKALGQRVAVLDADIYGPSMPKLFGLTGKPLASDADGKRMKPMSRYGIEVASIGFLIEEDTPMIWRGPMVMSALTQLLREVEWGDTDIMVIDMPPGTGDVQLSLAQQTPLSGAVIVSTPQDLALIDARKGFNMFRKVNVPIMGIVENMSYFICDQCNKRHNVFGHGGARLEADRVGVPFLGEIPLDMAIRETSDGGAPIVVSQPQSAISLAYGSIANQLLQQLAEGKLQRPPPRIVVDG